MIETILVPVDGSPQAQAAIAVIPGFLIVWDRC